MMLGHKFRAGLAAMAVISGVGLVPPAIAADPPDWSVPVKPFRIADDIYYVGTRGLAAYLIVSSQGAILLDGTTVGNAALIERNVQSVGISLRDVKFLISDHAHFDHVGALAQIKQDTGARFAASAEDRWALEHGQPRGDTDYPVRDFPAIKVDQTVADGETIHVGTAALTAHLTPGHTPGCTSWSMTVQEERRPLKVLFLCSITVAGNVLVGNRAYPDIVEHFRATFAKLADMKADILLTSHPEAADVLGREARRNADSRDAFIDPAALPSLVAASKAVFEAAVAQAQSAAR